MPESSAEKQRRRRARLRGLIPAIEACSSCGTPVRGPHGPLCSRCWIRTTEGREWQRLRMQAFRRSRRNVA